MMNEEIVFSHLLFMMPSDEAAKSLLLFEQAQQVHYLAMMGKVQLQFIPAVLREENIGSLQVFNQTDSCVAAILMSMAELAGENHVLTIIDELAQENPLIKEQLREHLFFFDEIANLSDRSMQTLLREYKLSPYMLVDTSDAVKNKLLHNVSKRVAQQALQELAYLASREIDQAAVHQAKGAFAHTVARLLSDGEIDPPEVSSPEALRKTPQETAAEDLKYIEDYVLGLSFDELYRFIREGLDNEVLVLLLKSGNGPAIREKVYPILSERMRNEFDKQAAAHEDGISDESAWIIERCRSKLK